MRKAVLIASGNYYYEYHPSKDDFIVGVDGGYDYLVKQNIVPNLIIGDFDSVQSPLPKDVEKIVLPTIKDDTDSLFAIKECIKRGYSCFELYGFLGDDIAHTLANIQTLHYLKEQNCKGTIITKTNTLEILCKEKKIINKQKGYFSIFSLTRDSIITLKNCKYPLNKQKITNVFPIGLHNEFIDEPVTVVVHEGTCIIIY